MTAGAQDDQAAAASGSISDEQRRAVIREIWSLIREHGSICGFAALWAYDERIKARMEEA